MLVKVVSSVDAWYATSNDIEEVLGHTRHSDFHIFVADVVKSFDTVDRGILSVLAGCPVIPFPMFMSWDRRPLLVSACYSAPPRPLVDT